MSSEYDVVIAGGGPAGGQAARDIAERGYDVVVLEQDSYVGETRQSTGGTFPPMMAEFGIPDEVTMSQTDKAVLEGMTEKLVMDHPGYVLDFGAFKEYLADDAVDKGAEYRLDSRVVDVDTDVEDGMGVVYNSLDGGGQETVTGDLVIDATGASAVLGRKTGLVDVEPRDFGLGVEYEMENVEMEEPGSMVFRLASDYAPGGYSWIFDTGGGTAKVGVCWYNEYKDRIDPDGSLEDYFEKFWGEDPRLQDAEKIEKNGEFERHAGKAFFTDIDTKVDDRLILAGDTVTSIDPVWGEGIQNCMISGRAAAIAADKAIKSGDFSRDTLETYEGHWDKRIGHNRDARFRMAHLMYRMSDDRLDRLVGDLDDLDPESRSSLNQNADLRVMASIAEPSDARLLAGYLYETAEDRVSEWVGDLKETAGL
ncbi:MAG: NAD(P)/FAD-dependent oxidoreductase [Candidatus Nanohaloarchaea archaeon]